MLLRYGCDSFLGLIRHLIEFSNRLNRYMSKQEKPLTYVRSQNISEVCHGRHPAGWAR